ncbi:methyltransferase [Cytobacillus sp. IB215316]|uniref:methyltransferase n=1 Tax=Cytobacillus sp. IB215316 TaxID=3097354 RepID=UPI002A17ABA9|nr:methyltransferase [Cytobacillus sp. IB215316]MDX8360747.1 methyltransferase [Cytobacillus sp. IB215316]
MEKVLVEIYIPVINQYYDVYLPLISKMYEIEELLAAAFSEISSGYFVASEDIVICEKNTGRIYDVNKSVMELDIRNGSKLMLI